MPKLRRVVTGQRPDGTSYVQADGEPPSVFKFDALPGYSISELWVADDIPVELASTATEPTGRAWKAEPPEGGLAWRIIERPPDSASNGDGSDLIKATGTFDEKESERDSSKPDMHQVSTLDLITVLSGELWLLLDEEEVHLTAGDCLIGTGVRKAWRNRGSVPCVFSVIAVSAQPRPE